MRRFVAATILTLMAAPVAQAETLILHGTTIGAPSFSRPLTTGSLNYPDTATFPADSAPYAEQPFYTDKSGHFDVVAFASGLGVFSGSWNIFVGVYAYSFDAAKPLQNLVFFNDEIVVNGVRAAGNPSTFDAVADTQYFAIITGVDWASGDYTLLLGSQGEISTGPFQSAVPEPASWSLMIGGLGLIGGMLRRQRMLLARFLA